MAEKFKGGLGRSEADVARRDTIRTNLKMARMFFPKDPNDPGMVRVRKNLVNQIREYKKGQNPFSITYTMDQERRVIN